MRGTGVGYTIYAFQSTFIAQRCTLYTVGHKSIQLILSVISSKPVDFSTMFTVRSRNDRYMWRYDTSPHGRRSVGGQGDMSPLLFEVEGTPCVLSPLLSGVDIFCSAQLHSNSYSLQFIWWMLTPLGPNRRVPFHVLIRPTIYDNDVNVMSPLCSYVAPQTLYIWCNRNRRVDN